MTQDAPSTEGGRTKSALVLIVPEVERQVGEFRRKYTVDGPSVPPHFTLMFPFLAPLEIDPGALQRIRDVAAAVPAFDFALSRVDRFPGSVMFLAPNSPSPFIDLVELYRRALPEVSPYWDKVNEIVPHLSVADESRVGSATRLADIERAVTAHLPIRCEAREVVLLREVSPSPAPWEVQERFPLAPRA